MGLLGVSGLLSSILIPGLSDKLGRKKALLIGITIGLFFPFSVFYLNGSALHLPAMFITYFTMGTIPLVAAIIPSEAVPDHLKAKAIGLTTAVAEVVGGVIIPGLAGALSDLFTPSAFLWVSATLAALGLFCVSQLKETHPKLSLSTVGA